MNCCQEVARQLVVPGCDTSEVLEAAEHTLDDIAAFVGGLVIAMRVFAGRIGRDDGLDATLGEFATQAVGVIGSVGQKAAGMSDHADKAACTSQIMGVAWRDQESQRAPGIIRQRVDFGGLPAARAADGIVEGPPFAPAAERCALM